MDTCQELDLYANHEEERNHNMSAALTSSRFDFIV